MVVGESLTRKTKAQVRRVEPRSNGSRGRSGTGNMRRVRRRSLPWLLLAVILVVPVELVASVSVTLKNSFIEEYENRATIETQFTVDKAHSKPNSSAKDSDLHVAGRAPAIGLPAVAEIMNAKQEKTAMAADHGAEGTGNPITITGAWRLRSEHGGGDAQVQGESLRPFTTTNPDHLFEVHPVTEVAGEDIGDSLKRLAGFKYKDADAAFQRYENLPSEIDCGASTTTITTGMAGHNYVDFVMELNEGPTHTIPDCLTVMASVLDRGGELLVRNRRMVFVKGTVPYDAVRALKQSDRLRVVGIPRMSLSLVAWRCEHAGDRPEALNWSLPYEMIIVSVLK